MQTYQVDKIYKDLLHRSKYQTVVVTFREVKDFSKFPYHYLENSIQFIICPSKEDNKQEIQLGEKGFLFNIKTNSGISSDPVSSSTVGSLCVSWFR